MSIKSIISWTQATWNPVVGCTKHSEGCQNCYAIRPAAARCPNADRLKIKIMNEIYD